MKRIVDISELSGLSLETGEAVLLERGYEKKEVGDSFSYTLCGEDKEQIDEKGVIKSTEGENSFYWCDLF